MRRGVAVVWVTATGLYVAAITVGSLLSEEVASQLVPGSRGVHLVAYLVMTVLVYWVGPRTWGSAAWSAGVCAAWGALLELLQKVVPGRTADWLDAGENAAGALAGWLIVAAVRLAFAAAEGPGRTESKTG